VLFDTAEPLGSTKTTFGLTKLRKDARLVIKKFKGEYAKISKKREEAAHLKLWDSLDNACRQHICEPIRTNHELISLQVYPGKDTDTSKQEVLTLEAFRKKLKEKKLKLNERLAKFMGTDDPHSIVKRQLIQALKCLHMKGFVHQDIKPDNMLVIFQLQNQKISYLKVKLIDFGITRYSADGKPLVKLTDDFQKMNFEKLNKISKHRPDKYSNRYLFMKTKNLPPTDRPHYVKTDFLPKYLGKDFRKVYRRELKRNAIRTQNIRKRVQDDPYKALKKIRNKVKAK
jgi:serine/threonine protein kinase